MSGLDYYVLVGLHLKLLWMLVMEGASLLYVRLDLELDWKAMLKMVVLDLLGLLLTRIWR